MDYRIGLDIGITSVGWAVLENGKNEEACKIVDLGVRIFDAAEEPKTGSSLALPRREARSARRRLRRHKHRLDRIKSLFEMSNFITRNELDNINRNDNVYELRYFALDKKLSKEQWARVLIHLAQRRGFKSNRKSELVDKKADSGKLLAATKENEILQKEKNYRTVGEMLFNDEKFKIHDANGNLILQTRNKSECYNHTILRDLIIDEINLLFEKQREHGNPYTTELMQQKYLEIFASQRPFDLGPGEPSPYGGDIIGKMIGTCTFEPTEKRCAKACYSFEYFVLLQDINKLKIVNTYGEVSCLKDYERQKLIDLAHVKADVKYSDVRKALQLKENENFKTLSYGNKEKSDVESKARFAQMKAYHEMRKCLDKLSKGLISTFSKDLLDQIGDILSHYQNDSSRIEQLSNLHLDANCIDKLLELSFSKYGHLSIKAIRKLIPYLEQGLLYNEACEKAGYDFRGHSFCDKSLLLNTEYVRNIVNDITNPVVRRAVSQSIKVINAIIRKYGSPQLVCIELAREMSKNFDERRKIDKAFKENAEFNEKIKKEIISFGKSNPTGLDIVKLKLWKEQNEFCPYSLEKLDITRLFEPGYVDVDHIIPYSISFDDSYKNKILVKSEENRQKGNRIPYAYFGKDEQRWHNFEQFIATNIRDYHKRERLLKKEITKDDEENFKERNLNDTKYISRFIYNLINDVLEFAPSEKYNKKRVMAVNGSITYYMRKCWGLNKDRNENDLHHAQDAVVIACTSDGMIQKITRYSKGRELLFAKSTSKNLIEILDAETGELKKVDKIQYDKDFGIKFPQPWEGFKEELFIRLSSNPMNYLSKLVQLGYDYNNEVKPIFVSRMPKRKNKGSGHKDTIRSAKALDKNLVITKTDIRNLTLDKDDEIKGYYNPQDDILLYNALKQQLKKFNGDGEKAFESSFYKPKADGTNGNPVKKIQIYEKVSLGVVLNNINGYAANGSMVRIDVFKKDGFYFVPIYTADTLKLKLPNKAVVANKPYSEWKEMDNSFEFLFSLYPNDLVKIKHKSGINATKSNGGKVKINDVFLYYNKAGINTGGLDFVTHDKDYEIVNLGLKTLESIEKYQVDVLGNISKVKGEKRQEFIKEMV